MRTSIAFALAAAKLAASHATFQSFVIDGKDQGQHTAVRTPSNANNPIYDVTSSAMTCNGGTAAADTLEVAAGSEIGLQWHHNDPATTSGDSDEPIASSHKGPVMVYIAPADSNGEGAVWTKIYADGYDGSKWGVDNFITNKGLVTVTLPDLTAGEYLIRPEIIALHEASTSMKAQFYNGCGQIKITGSGSVSLPSTGTDMTKAYSASDPGVLVNIYSGLTSYEIPGPAVWDGSSSGGATPASSATPAATSAAATSAAATSAVVIATPTQVADVAKTSSAVASSTPTSTAAAPASPSATGGASSGALPETFTLDEFISWLQANAGSENAKRFIRSIAGPRAHPRAFL